MNYKGYSINPKIARELDEILAGNRPNSNDNRKDGSK